MRLLNNKQRAAADSGVSGGLYTQPLHIDIVKFLQAERLYEQTSDLDKLLPCHWLAEQK